MQSPASHDPRFVRVDRWLQQNYIETGRLAGANLAIQYRGRLHASCFGFLDRERTRPTALDSIFRIFSMTKPITSVALMMLVERGAVRLQDPVSHFIPAWAGLRTHGGIDGGGMRIIDLLTHCSGLTYGIQYRTEIDTAYRKTLSMRHDGQDLQTMVEKLGQLPLEFTPGSAWNYSIATDVLGFIIEKVSGGTFRDFLKSQILDPLGMTDTDFNVPAAQAHRLAGCYVRRPQELLGAVSSSFESDPTAQPCLYSGGGGLFSTLGDYLSFCNAILSQGRGSTPPLLSPDSWALMSTNHLPAGGDLPAAAQGLFAHEGYRGIGFGLGWATTIDPHTSPLRGSLGDAFWSGMANTFFWCDPATELTAVFMTQLLPSEIYPLQREIRSLIYDAVRPTALPA
jgi:CubicO group peptidase (beta-lactamase class C family)